MWLVFGSKSKSRRVRDGQRMEGVCPSCHRRATFYETEVLENLHAFWIIDLYDHVERAMQCGECLTLLKPDDDTTAQASKAPRASVSKAPGRLALDARKHAEDARRHDAEIDAELAALKRKLGK